MKFITCVVLAVTLFHAPTKTLAAGEVILAKGEAITNNADRNQEGFASENELKIALEKSADQVHAFLENPSQNMGEARTTIQEIILETRLARLATSNHLGAHWSENRKAKTKSALYGLGKTVGAASFWSTLTYGLLYSMYHVPSPALGGPLFVLSFFSGVAGLVSTFGIPYNYFVEDSHKHFVKRSYTYNETEIAKKAATWDQIFWDRLRAHGHDIPKGQEYAWLDLRLSDSAEDAALFSSKAELIRETKRFKESVLNTASLYDPTSPEFQILKAFGESIEVPGIGLKLWASAGKMTKLVNVLQAKKQDFRKLAHELNIDQLRPIDEIVRMPLSAIWGIENHTAQIRRIFNPQDSETRSFLFSLSYEDFGPELLTLMTRADKGEIKIKTKLKHNVRIGTSETIPMGVHHLNFKFEVEDLADPSKNVTIEGQTVFGSKYNHVAEVAKSNDWKNSFVNAVHQAIKDNPATAEVVCEAALLPQQERTPLPTVISPVSAISENSPQDASLGVSRSKVRE